MEVVTWQIKYSQIMLLLYNNNKHIKNMLLFHNNTCKNYEVFYTEKMITAPKYPNFLLKS